MSEKRQVESVGIRRAGAENDPDARVSVSVRFNDGTVLHLGSEPINSNFSTWWTVDETGKAAN